MIKGFIDGWKLQFGTNPQKKSIAVLWSQWSIETGQGKFFWNNNIGNIKFVASNTLSDDSIQYMMLSNVWEIIKGKKVTFQPPHPSTWFRSFFTLAEGIAFHLDFLKNKRYKKAWEAVESGNPNDFAHLLKLANYYTAPESDYAKAVVSYFNKFMKDDTFDKIISELEASSNLTKNVVDATKEIVLAQKEATQQVITDINLKNEPIKNSFWKSITDVFSKFK